MMHSSVCLVHIWCVTMEQPAINPEKIQAVAQDFQHPQHEEQTVKNDDLPRKQSKWQLVVDVINRIGAVILRLFQPYDEPDRFHHSVEELRSVRWGSFNR